MLELKSLGTQGQIHLLTKADRNGKSQTVNIRGCRLDVAL